MRYIPEVLLMLAGILAVCVLILLHAPHSCECPTAPRTIERLDPRPKPAITIFTQATAGTNISASVELIRGQNN